MILLDLNYTLVSNSAGVYPFTREIIEAERYRKWLVDAIRDEFVILITVRNKEFQEFTLKHILKHTGWQPDDYYFPQRFEMGGAPETKLKGLKSYIYPKYGSDPSQYLAIESNPKTTVMYSGQGIKAMNQSTYRKKVYDQRHPTLFG